MSVKQTIYNINPILASKKVDDIKKYLKETCIPNMG
jgi:hypothetical protein